VLLQRGHFLPLRKFLQVFLVHQKFYQIVSEPDKMKNLNLLLNLYQEEL
jgi:hypothetical protein